MPRRGRRSGVRFIEDDKDRSLSFFKRRAGLFKAIDDLSTLTGARIVVVLESENGRFSSFGIPAAGPIVDAFLSGNPPMESDASEMHKAIIINLQNEMFQLEKQKAVEDKRKKESIARTKEIQESSRMAKYVYGKEEDLDANELYEMYYELSRVQQQIKHRLPTLRRGYQVEAGGLRDPSLLQASWWRSMPSQAVPPQSYSQWAASKPSLKHPQPSSSRLVQARSGSSLPNSLMLSPSQLPPNPLLQCPLAHLTPSMVRLQAQKISPILPSQPPEPSLVQIPPSNESLPLSPFPQFSSPLHLESWQLRFNVQSPQNFATAGSTSIPSNEPYYGSLSGLNIDLGGIGGNGGQTSAVHNRFGFSESSSARESYGADVGNNLGDLNYRWY